MITEGKQCLLINPRWMTKVFVAGDVLSFLAQLAGESIIAS